MCIAFSYIIQTKDDVKQENSKSQQHIFGAQVGHGNRRGEENSIRIYDYYQILWLKMEISVARNHLLLELQ